MGPAKHPDLAEVVIVGGGFAGSLLALTLAREGTSVAVVDLHRVYPADFRCEKLGANQAAMLMELDALAPIAARAGVMASTPEQMAQWGVPYQDMVNGLRDAWPSQVRFHEARVAALHTSEDWQSLELSTGERLFGRLVVLATGRNERLRRQIGVRRRTLRERHSLCIGLTLEPADAARPIPSMVVHSTRAGDGLGFVSLFPMNGATRVNLFCYRDPDSAWTQSFRKDPIGALVQTFPRLAPLLAGARAISAPDFGVIDLYATEGVEQPGVVLIGDAFCSSCPATAMGLTRAITDVTRLARVYAPAWLGAAGMGADKIAAFYADPVKQAVDHRSRRRAELGRFEATSRGLVGWAARSAQGARRALRAAVTDLRRPIPSAEAAR